MKILFIGHSEARSSTRHRADALTRLGHEIVHLADPYPTALPPVGRALWPTLNHHSGYRFVQRRMQDWTLRLAKTHRENPPHLIWIDHGELFGPRALQFLRELGAPLVLHNVDDPTGTRDGHRFDTLLKALSSYDLCVVVKDASRPEFLCRGANAVFRTWMGYDEIRHAPFEDPGQIHDRFRSDVAFVGTWIRGEGRDRFLLDLVDRGLDVAVWGNRWQRAPLWKRIEAHWRGPALTGRDYVAAIQGSKVALGLLSRRNRDLHTARSMEIPYAGGLLCAERTSEHLQIYTEDVEAVFWKDADECAAVCRRLLGDAQLRESIRSKGAARVRRDGYGNERICREILDRLLASFPALAAAASQP